MKDHSQDKNVQKEKKKDLSATKPKKKSLPDPKQRDLVSLLKKSSKAKPITTEIVDSDSDADEPLSNLKWNIAKNTNTTKKKLSSSSPPLSPHAHQKSHKEKLKGTHTETVGGADKGDAASRKLSTLVSAKTLPGCKVLVNGIENIPFKKSPLSPKSPKSPLGSSKKSQKIISPTTSPNEKTKVSPPPLVISPKRVTEKDSTAAADIFSWKIPRKRKSDEKTSSDCGVHIKGNHDNAFIPKKKEVQVKIRDDSPVKAKKQKLDKIIKHKKDGSSEKISEKNKKTEKDSSRKYEKKKTTKSSSLTHNSSITSNDKTNKISKEKASNIDKPSKKSEKIKKLKKKVSNEQSKDKVARSIIFSSDDSEADLPLSKLKGGSPKIKTTEKKTEKSPRIKVTKKVSKNTLKQKSLLDFAEKGQSKKIQDSGTSLHERFASSGTKKDTAEKKSLKKPLTEEEKKERQKQRILAKRELNKKVDDHELERALPLPVATPVTLANEITVDAFGNILMVTEFLVTFHKLMMPEDNSAISAEELANALGSGEKGFRIVSKVLLVFLRILCAEEDAEIEGLCVSIADMPLTIYTVSELLRYYLEVRATEKEKETSAEKSDIIKEETDKEEKKELLPSKAEDVDNDTSSVSSEGERQEESQSELPKRLIKQLKQNEFFTMSAADQLKIIVYLFNQVLDSAEFSEHLASLQAQSKDVFREQDVLRKKKAKERRDQLAKQEESKLKEETPKVGAIDKFVTKTDPTDFKTESATHDLSGKDSKEKENSKEVDEEKKENIKEIEKEEPETKVKDDGDKPGEGKENSKNKDQSKQSDKEHDKDAENNKDKEHMKEEEMASDLVMVVKQRRLLAAQQHAMKEELEKKEKERRAKMEEEYQQQKKIQGWKDTIDKCKRSMRLDSIGCDRDYKLYWILSGGSPYLYVEDGWMYHESGHKQISSWGYYSTIEEINELLKTLCERGIREHALKMALLTHYNTLTNKMKRKQQEPNEVGKHEEDDTVSAFHVDIIESATRSVKGNLGNMPDLDAWQEKVKMTTDIKKLASFVLELQGSIFQKNFQGFLSTTNTDSKQSEFWRELVENVETMSALHLLLGLLENSISWDRSAENAKCKVCRRKGDELLVLCDICNCAYHGYCLRPALDYLPPEGWQCPACKPLAKRQRRCLRSELKEEEIESEVEEEEEEEEESGDASDDGDEDESGSEEGSDHESACHVCGEGGEVICCDTCPLVFHLECHDPPLRRLPRGTWNCCECRNPKRSSRSQSQGKAKQTGKKSAPKQKRKAARRKRISYRSSQEEEDDSDIVDEDIEEKPVTRRERAPRQRLANQSDASNESDSDSKDDDDTRKAKRSSLKQRNTGSNRRRSATKRLAPKSEKENRPSLDKKENRRKRKLKLNSSSDETPLQASSQGRKRRKRTDDSEASDNKSAASVTQENILLGSKKRESVGGRHRRGENYEITACENIMAKLWGNDCAWAFKAPVNLKQIPDYLNYVETPMDLWTIREKLNRLEYEDAFQFIEDVRLVLKNSRSYNSDTSDVGKAGIKLEGYFQDLLSTYLPGIASTLNGV